MKKMNRTKHLGIIKTKQALKFFKNLVTDFSGRIGNNTLPKSLRKIAAKHFPPLQDGNETVQNASVPYVLLKEEIKEPVIATPFIRGIETTNYCGCHCKTCPYDQMTRPKGYIDDETFKMAIENVLNYTTERIITLHHFGDPLLHPKLPELINYAGSKGLQTKISTIGVALTPKLIDELVNSKLTVIKFSFWGIDKNDFEDYQKASYRRTMDNINKFIEKNKTIKIVIELLSNGKHDITQLQYYEQWKDLLQVKRVGNWIGDDDKVNNYTQCKPVSITKPCERFWKSDLKILCNGDVVPCCADYNGNAVIGNIKEDNIETIWRSEKMNTLRELHLKGRRNEIELCKLCGGSAWTRPSKEELLS